jgi:hypothetical protein
LLIRKVLIAALQIFTVTFTVNLSGTSIDAGLRAIRPEATFRNLSTYIDSHDGRGQHRRHHRRASVPARETPNKGWHQTR